MVTRISYVLLTLFMLCLLIIASGCTGTNNTAQTPTPSVIVKASTTPVPPPAVTSGKLYGIDFSPYIDGQDPDYGAKVNVTQLRDRMSIVAPHTEWIRTFGSSGGLENSGVIAHELGLKVAVGAWLGKDTSANEREISALISEANAGDADLVIVGSETLYRNDLTEDQLIDYIKRVKQAAPNVKVTTADTYGELKAHPRVVEACDVVMVNYYPYFDGISIDDAIPVMKGAYADISNMSGGKQVIVSETGWPSTGDIKGKAVPSPENASLYFNEFVSWARGNNISYFYFEAFDETWKIRSEGPQGAHWGIWDKDGRLKPGMEKAFG